MKNILKLNLFFLLLLSSSIAWGTCGQIVPFASEPVVEGCCVTYEMDLSLGVNWILYPGNNLPQSASVSSHSNGGSNVYQHCYVSASGTIYPNISYYDANWNFVCSSVYPVALECTFGPPLCGVSGSQIDVDGCHVQFSVWSRDYRTEIAFYDANGTLVKTVQVPQSSNPPTTVVDEYFTPPGDYSIRLICYDAQGNQIAVSVHTFTVGVCHPPRPRSSDLDETKLTGVKVYPNPASDLLVIGMEGRVIQNIQLFDVNNRLLLDRRSNEGDKYNLDLSPVQSSGIYYLRIMADDKFYNQKVVIQK